MASSTQDELNRAFLAASGQQTAAIGDTTAMLADVVAQVRDMLSSIPAPATASKAPTTTQTTPTDSGVTVGSVVSTVFKSGFGLAPLISGLVSLFSGGDATTPPPLVKYALPANIDFQAAESGGQVSGLDYDQMGIPRNYSETALSGGASADVNGLSSGVAYDQTGNQPSSGASVPGMGAAPQITVNVQAMDARSFLDRSNDIALAVRDAMLNMNAINDVVNEL